MSTDPILIGLDPGFASLGWAAMRFGANTQELVGLGVIRTRKTDRKARILESSDLHRRGQEIARELVTLLDRYAPIAICAEAISYPRAANVSAMMGRAWGILDALCTGRHLALVEVSPQDLKRIVAGGMSASKADVLDALDVRFKGAVRRALAKTDITPSQHEHAVDALGAIVACLDSDTVRLLRRMTATNVEVAS